MAGRCAGVDWEFVLFFPGSILVLCSLVGFVAWLDYKYGEH